MGRESWDYIRLLMRLLYVCICDFVGEEVGGKVVATHASSFCINVETCKPKKGKYKIIAII